jgi:hypothetical protein
MHNAAGDRVAQALDDQNAAYRAVVTDLVSLVEHVQNSLRRMEQMIVGETPPGSPESSTNIVVLDDISPRYMKSAAGLRACGVNLGIALRSLQDSGDSNPCAARRPALSVIRAQGQRGAVPRRDDPPPQIFPRIFWRG